MAGQGPPLLLVHSINAAASAAELRPLHEHYRASRTVFTIDLPGYGFSERSDRAYTPALMTDALLAMVAQIRRRCGDVPVDALAQQIIVGGHSAGARFAVRLGERLAALAPQRLAGALLFDPVATPGFEAQLPALRRVRQDALDAGHEGFVGVQLHRACDSPRCRGRGQRLGRRRRLRPTAAGQHRAAARARRAVGAGLGPRRRTGAPSR